MVKYRTVGLIAARCSLHVTLLLILCHECKKLCEWLKLLVEQTDHVW